MVKNKNNLNPILRSMGVKSFGDMLEQDLFDNNPSKTIIPLAVVNKFRAKKEENLLEREGLEDNIEQDSSIKEEGRSISEKVYRLISRMNFNENVPLYVTTIEGELAYINDGYRNLVMGCAVAVKQDEEKTDGGHKLPDSLVAILNEVQLTKNILNFKEIIKFKSSSKYFKSRHFPICDKSGEVIAVGGTYVEILDDPEFISNDNLLQSRFRDFARATSDWYWEVDKNLEITYAHERLSSIIGQPAFTLKGKKIEGFGTLKSDINGSNLKSSDVMDGVRPFRDQLFVMKDYDGDDIFIHLSGVPLYDSISGEFQGYRGAGMDVTSKYKVDIEKIRIQESLEHTLDELTNKNIQLDIATGEAEAALNAKSEFVAAMSHELRTPLNAIIGFAEVMKLEIFGDLNPQYVSYSNDIMNAGKHLLALINDVLDVAVLENGTMSLHIEEAILSEHIQNALNLVILRANDKNLNTDDVVTTCNYAVKIDKRRFTQILVNLLSNAVKFTPDGGRIGIDIAVSKLYPSLLAVTVWDTGIGIPEEQYEIIFEKFQQAKGSVYSREQEGTGLGLHISRHLATQMQGDITVESTVGKGTRFTLYVPLA
jgi:PAS domain S-box-containing protein